MSPIQSLLGNILAAGPTPPWQIEPNQRESDLEEGSDVLRLLAKITAARQGGRMQTNDAYAPSPRAAGAMGSPAMSSAPTIPAHQLQSLADRLASPEAGLLRSQFWTRPGNRTPETTADLAAIDARTQQYANQIRGHGFGSSFGDYAPTEAGNPEDRRMAAINSAMMPASERALLASRRSPVQEMLAGDPAPFRGGEPNVAALGAAGPSGPSGAAGAMGNLMASRGGHYFPGVGYMPERLMNDVMARIGAGEPEAQVVADVARRSNIGRGRGGVSGISPSYQAKLDERAARAQDRGRLRGAARSGIMPADLSQDAMAMNFLQRNPQVAAEILRLHGQGLDRDAKQLELKMEREMRREEADMKARLGGDALKIQQYEALVGAGVPEEDAYARVYGALPDGAAPIGGDAPTPRDRGLEFQQRELDVLAGKSREDIIAYGRTQGWSDEKIDRAIRQITGSEYANIGGGGWTNWLFSGGGTPVAPGMPQDYSLGNIFYSQPERARSSDRHRR